jgi:uncharacterized protein involved in outer membrane biogenesis
MRRIRMVMVVAVVALAASLVFALFFLDSSITAAVNKKGPALTGTTVSLKDTKFSPLTGRLQLYGLIVGNPEGFTTPDAVRFSRLTLKLKPLSLLSRVIVIEEILIDAPEITYEIGAGDSNLSRIEKNISGERPSVSAPPGPGAEPRREPAARQRKKKDPRKFQIDQLVIRNGRVHLSATLLHGARATIPLPPIQIDGIGKERGGATLSESITLILKSVADTVSGNTDDTGDAGEKAIQNVAGALKGLLDRRPSRQE